MPLYCVKCLNKLFIANTPIKEDVKIVKCTLGNAVSLKEWNCLVSPFKTLFLH